MQGYQFSYTNGHKKILAIRISLFITAKKLNDGFSFDFSKGMRTRGMLGYKRGVQHTAYISEGNKSVLD